MLWTAAFLFSCVLGTAYVVPRPSDGHQSVARAVFGETCDALSGHFYDTADKYFHKGVEHVRPEAFKGSIFQRAADEISPRAHVHLVGEEIKEMMPWLSLAIRTNPRRLDTYLVAAFWLATDANRPDLALNVLAEAQQNIPSSHEIQLERGCLLLRENKLKEAREALDTGLAFWPGNGKPDSREMQYDRARLLLYRAVLHEIDGKNMEAIAALEEILTMYPERTALKERIAELREGKEPSLLPASRLKQMLKNDAKHRHGETCGRKEEHDHDHDEEHD